MYVYIKGVVTEDAFWGEHLFWDVQIADSAWLQREGVHETDYCIVLVHHQYKTVWFVDPSNICLQSTRRLSLDVLDGVRNNASVGVLFNTSTSQKTEWVCGQYRYALWNTCNFCLWCVCHQRHSMFIWILPNLDEHYHGYIDECTLMCVDVSGDLQSEVPLSLGTYVDEIEVCTDDSTIFVDVVLQKFCHSGSGGIV